MDKFELPQEFRLTLSSKIMYLVLATAFGALLFYGVRNGVFFRDFLTSLVTVLIGLGGTLVLVGLIRRKIVLYETSLSFTGLFSKRKINFADIKGYRIAPKLLKIVSKDSIQRDIRIGNYFDFKQSDQIVNWITESFIDLNAVDLKNELESFLQDETFESTPEKQATKLKLAKNVALAYNIWGGIFGFIFGFFPQQFTFIILLAIPLIGVTLLYTFNLIKFLTSNQETIKPHIFYGFIIPCVSLLFKTAQPSFFDYQNMWLPLIGFSSLVIFLICYRGINKFTNPIFMQVLIIVVAGSLYGLGAFKTVNCIFDTSPARSIAVTIQDKFIRKSKVTSYYFKLTPWNSENGETEERVSMKIFNQKQIGETVNIQLKNGVLNVPWYTVSSNEY